MASIEKMFEHILNTNQPNYLQHNEDLDLLVVSCCMHRVGRFNGWELDDCEISEFVEKQDYELADALQDHYEQKFAMLKLKGTYVSPFRTSVINLFSIRNQHKQIGKGPKYLKDHFGPLVKLPRFFFYDQFLEEIFEGIERPLVGVSPDKSPLGASFMFCHEPMRITYINCHPSVQKRLPGMEYWFKDEDGNRIRLMLDHYNPMKKMFEYTIENNQAISIESPTITFESFDNLKFMSASSWSLVPG